MTKAVSIGDIEGLKQLIYDKANVEERSGMAGNTPLHCAARANQFEAVKLLLQNKSDVDAQRKTDLLTPLHSASHAGNLKIVEYLVAAGAKYWLLDKKNNTPYDVAKRMKNNDVIEFLAVCSVHCICAMTCAITCKRCRPYLSANPRIQRCVLNE